MSNNKPEEIQLGEEIDLLIGENSIVLYNDDVNTFDWVIDCLIDLCQHTPEQAEQCAYLVHYKGKCEVKTGSFETLQPICNDLCRRGLNAKIE